MEEEYVETEYYKDLNGIDKEHHTVIPGSYPFAHFCSICSNITLWSQEQQAVVEGEREKVIDLRKEIEAESDQDRKIR